jgi:hypothetical protein
VLIIYSRELKVFKGSIRVYSAFRAKLKFLQVHNTSRAVGAPKFREGSLKNLNKSQGSSLMFFRKFSKNLGKNIRGDQVIFFNFSKNFQKNTLVSLYNYSNEIFGEKIADFGHFY